MIEGIEHAIHRLYEVLYNPDDFDKYGEVIEMINEHYMSTLERELALQKIKERRINNANQV